MSNSLRPPFVCWVRKRKDMGQILCRGPSLDVELFSSVSISRPYSGVESFSPEAARGNCLRFWLPLNHPSKLLEPETRPISAGNKNKREVPSTSFLGQSTRVGSFPQEEHTHTHLVYICSGAMHQEPSENHHQSSLQPPRHLPSTSQ